MIDFISSTTQLLFIIGVAVLMLGYVVSGLYWIVAGPDGKRRAIEWVKHVTIGGLILVLSRPAASYIIQSFSMIPCGGG
ncbi:MAG: hypothetical protein SV186_04080 [Candidatus Nanohaloarchaea archaeon]|nr:hypothetical protein [Candidatus Nanohaloarchaea archaeon]